MSFSSSITITSSLTRGSPARMLRISRGARPSAGLPHSRRFRSHSGAVPGYHSSSTTMALHPGIGTPVLDRLGPRDVPEVLSFLEEEPVLNVYLIALVLRDALARPNDVWWGARRDGRLSALLFVGGHSGAVLPAGDDPQAHRLLGQRASEAKLARPARLQIIGPRAAVAAVREHFPAPGAQARLERNQVYLALDHSPGTPGTIAPELRNARREDYAL